MTTRAVPSYTTVTELPGARVTREQISMLYTRYRWAKIHSVGRDVLEVACGPGVGLGYLARSARRVVGGDYDRALLGKALAHYGGGARLLCLDAHALPFGNRTFDVVVLFEALYYLKQPESFMREARRVLRPAGTLLMCLPNREWPGFNPSPFAHRYPSIREVNNMLTAAGFAPHFYGAFSTIPGSRRDRILLAIRRAAVEMHLIPATMRGKETLKRLVFGPLVALPAEIHDGIAPEDELRALRADVSAPPFKVLYAEGRTPG